MIDFKFFLTLIVLLGSIGNVNAGTAKGSVYIDTNKNGIRDGKEPGVAGISVSNGNDVVITDSKGEWRLNIDDDFTLFVIKPAGYSVAVNQNMIPEHFYRHNSEQKIPKSIDFPLYLVPEKKKFSALFFSDTQARGLREVDFILHDAVDELIGTDALFGVSLGDIVADDPGLFSEINQGLAQIGIPWYNTFGNHDSDREATNNNERDETFERFFGPSTYAFEYADVVFIDLNNIYFNPNGKYRPHFTENQLTFVENYINLIPENKLVVLMMHAPIVACDNQKRMYQIIQNRKYTFSISGHVHEQLNLFVGKENGWEGEEEHHHLINATVCGSWWCGTNDELGIPHATMNDGAPNGYSRITFDGNQYSVEFKAARRPADYQMNIYLPNEISKSGLETTQILVNVFAGSQRSKVEMKIGKNGEWILMEQLKTIDPECLRMHKLNSFLSETVNGEVLEDVFGFKMDYPSTSDHIWGSKLPKNILSGTHTVTVRTTDMYNKTWQAHRIFRVRESEN